MFEVTPLENLKSEFEYLKKEKYFIDVIKEEEFDNVLTAMIELVKARQNGTLHHLAQSKHQYFDNEPHEKMALRLMLGAELGNEFYNKVWKIIENRVYVGLPLTEIEDTPDMWEPVQASFSTHKRAKGIVFKLSAGETVCHPGTIFHTPSPFSLGWEARPADLIPISLPSVVDIWIKNIYLGFDGERVPSMQADEYLQGGFIKPIMEHCRWFDTYRTGEFPKSEVPTNVLMEGIEIFLRDFCEDIDKSKWVIKSRRKLFKVIKESLSDYMDANLHSELYVALVIYQNLANCDCILKVRGISNKNRVRGIAFDKENLMATHALGIFHGEQNEEWKEDNVVTRTIKVIND